MLGLRKCWFVGLLLGEGERGKKKEKERENATGERRKKKERKRESLVMDVTIHRRQGPQSQLIYELATK